MVKRFLFFTLILCLSANLIVAENSSLSQIEIDKAYETSYAYEKSQNYSKATEVLLPVYTAFENTYTINFRMGWLSYLNGNITDAARYYAKALSIYPSSLEVLTQIAQIYKDKMNWPRVEEENQKIIKIDYYNVTANYWYAYALKMQKKYSTAVTICKKMLAVYPTSNTFLFELGENLYYLGNYQDSYYVFVSLHTIDPANTSVNGYLAIFNSNQGKSSSKKKK